eukprot:7385582-Prymnesium_polylepis.1
MNSRTARLTSMVLSHIALAASGCLPVASCRLLLVLAPRAYGRGRTLWSTISCITFARVRPPIMTPQSRSRLLTRNRVFLLCKLPHPLAQQRVVHARDQRRFRSPISGAFFAIIADHVINDRVIVPGAAFLEMAHSVCRQSSSTSRGGAALREAFFLHPLVVSESSAAS